MPKKNEFQELKLIEEVSFVDETNYLEIDYRVIGQESGNVEFDNNIQQLWNTRNSIKRAAELGLQDRIQPPIQQYYLEAVRWLKSQAPTSSWVAINPFGQSGDRTSEMSQFSASWMPNYLSSFYNSPLMVALFIETQKTRKFLSKNLQQEISDLTQESLVKVDRRSKKVLKDFEDIAANKKNELKNEIDTATTFISTKKDEVEVAVAQASLTDWSKYYKSRVKEYNELLNGKNIVEYKNFKWDFFRFECSIIWQWTKSLKAKRAIWFTLLALVLISFVLVSTGYVSLPLTDDISKEINNPLLFKIGITAPIILIPSVGYAFANKNFRIYANILEQYRHREVVAETLSGIIASFGNDASTANIRQQLTAIGANAIFEHKNTGHLTKKDGDSMPITEIIQSLTRR